MAEGQQKSLRSFKEKLDDQLICSVCLDQYTNPKTLPCLHSFCLMCIEQIPEERKHQTKRIRCPTCRVDHPLPQGGANNLPNVFQINTLFDLRTTLAKNESATPTQSTCPKHNDLLTVFCETCDQVICRDCTISTEHNKHEFYLISECYPKHHQQIQGNLNNVKQKLNDMDNIVTVLATRETEVCQQGEIIKEQINEHAQQLIESIQQSRRQLSQQVDTVVQLKTETLVAQRQQAQKMHMQLKTCQDMIENSLKELNQRQILTQKNSMIDKMKTTTQHVNPAVVFQPIENVNIQYNKTEKKMGSITAKTYSGKATLEVSSCVANQQSTAILTLHSQNGLPFSLPPSLISCTFSSPSNKHLVKCLINPSKLGNYKISFTPSTRNDQLIVQVGGVDVPDSPFTLPVIRTPEIRREPVDIINGMRKPWGIAVCDNGDIVVAENGAHCVTILNRKGEKIRTFNKFIHPREVAISVDGHILVTDDHRLQKLTTDGVCVKSVGSSKSGSGELEFYYPRGIAVDPKTGKIFVADSWKNRIQVFSNNLNFLQTITPSFIFPLQFNLPCDIAIDNHGYLYITESSNHCITKLSSRLRYITRFCNRGSAPGQLDIPFFLTIHNNLVYVCEYGNNRVSVFDTDGKFQYQFGENKMLKCPSGITMDALGNLYVSDTDNNRIIIF